MDSQDDLFLHGWTAKFSSKPMTGGAIRHLILLTNPILGWQDIPISEPNGFRLLSIIRENEINANSTNKEVLELVYNLDQLLNFIDGTIFKYKPIFLKERHKIKPYGMKFLLDLTEAIDRYCNPRMENKRLTKNIQSLFNTIKMLNKRIAELEGR